MPETPDLTLPDARARADLYDRHAAGVYGLALHMLERPALAETVTEDVFAALWRSGAADGLAAPAVAGWLRSEARNRSLRMLPRFEPAACDPQVPAAIPAHRLPDPERAVIGRAYFGGRSARDIADADGLPAGRVHALIRAGLESLARSIDPVSLSGLETA